MQRGGGFLAAWERVRKHPVYSMIATAFGVLIAVYRCVAEPLDAISRANQVAEYSASQPWIHSGLSATVLSPVFPFWLWISSVLLIGYIAFGGDAKTELHVAELHPVADTTSSTPQQSASQDKAAVVPERRPAVTEEAGRIFVAVAPEYLIALFNDHMEIQATGLAAPYMGKWMRLSGPLDNVSTPNTDGEHMAVLSNHKSPGMVFMYFGKEWSERLAVIPKGTVLTVSGSISNVDSMAVRLRHCELT